MDDRYTITFTYEELDTMLVALACYSCSITKEREGGGTDRPERAIQVLAAIDTAEMKLRARYHPKRPDKGLSPVGEREILEYAQDCGEQAAANLLLLLGPDRFDGDYDTYHKLEAHLKQGEGGLEGKDHD